MCILNRRNCFTNLKFWSNEFHCVRQIEIGIDTFYSLGTMHTYTIHVCISQFFDHLSKSVFEKCEYSQMVSVDAFFVLECSVGKGREIMVK